VSADRLGGKCQPDDGIVEDYADEENEEHPAQRTDLPSRVHAASVGMPIRVACVSLRRGFKHRGE
jgi:hypothetical protein